MSVLCAHFIKIFMYPLSRAFEMAQMLTCLTYGDNKLSILKTHKLEIDERH